VVSLTITILFLRSEEAAMTVKIVTDSVSDIPPEIVQELGITVVPLYVHFGEQTYRDGIDLTTEEFYRKLKSSPILPRTSAPGPGIFAQIFDKLAKETNEILVITLSQRFSAVYQAALQGIELMKEKGQVTVVDSKTAIMGQGLLVTEAAKEALSGASLQKIVDNLHRRIGLVHIRATMDTLKYLAMGGRIGKAQAFLGAMLRINPILGIKNGEAFPFSRERSRARAIEALYKFSTSFTNVKAIAVEHALNKDEAKALAKQIASTFSKIPVYISQVSPVIGTHAGPGILSVSVLESEGD